MKFKLIGFIAIALLVVSTISDHTPEIDQNANDVVENVQFVLNVTDLGSGEFISIVSPGLHESIFAVDFVKGSQEFKEISQERPYLKDLYGHKARDDIS